MRWVPPPPVPVGGTVTIDGTITGPLRDYAHPRHVEQRPGDRPARNVSMAGPVLVTLDATTGTR